MENGDTIRQACGLMREEIEKLESAAVLAARLRGAAHRSAKAHVRTATAAIKRGLAEVTAAAKAAPPPGRDGPVRIPDPVPDVDQDPQD